MKIDWKSERNLTMLTDYYELTMSNGYFQLGIQDKRAVFDMYFRTIPDEAGFAIFAGLEQLIDYLEHMNFTEEDIEFFRSKQIFDEKFLDYLRHFKFECDVYSFLEGTPIFPNEPIVTVVGPIVQAQLVETMVLLTINHQSLVATKSNRIVRAAQGRKIMEFGSRRAQSYDAAILGARASYIGGCDGTACVISDRDYRIPALGTMAHSWIQVFDSEYEAFANYARLYPQSCVLLVDTYNVLKSGIPNAIKVFDEVLKPMGYRPVGVRIDSGDIAYLSKKARKMLNEAGYPDVKITASNSLDEYLIRDLLVQGAQIDSFGVGEKLITSKSEPVFGGVYKLAAIEEDGQWVPRIKISETVQKVTTPYFKNVYRFFFKEDDSPVADYITMRDEVVDVENGITIFDPNATWKRRFIKDIYAKEMMHKIYDKGTLVYELPKLEDIRSYCLDQVAHLWDEVKRFEYPHKYYVDLSEKLWNSKQELLTKITMQAK